MNLIQCHFCLRNINTLLTLEVSLIGICAWISGRQTLTKCLHLLIVIYHFEPFIEIQGLFKTTLILVVFLSAFDIYRQYFNFSFNSFLFYLHAKYLVISSPPISVTPSQRHVAKNLTVATSLQ